MSQRGEVKILYPNASHFGGFVRLPETLDERLRCVECYSLLIGPLQVPCGHRICTPCAQELKQRK